MPKKGSRIWIDQIVNGMKPEYEFDSPWYLGGPCRFGCRWKDTGLSLRRRYEKKGEIPKGQSKFADKCACRYYGENWLFNFLRQESIGISGNRRLGVLCPKGHDWNGTGFSLRYSGVGNNHCVRCDEERRNTPKRKKQKAEHGKKWYLQNKEKHLANTKKNRLLRLEADPHAEKTKKKLHKHNRKARERNAHSLPGVSKSEIRQYLKNNFPLNACVYCGKKGEIHLDHFYPLALGGPNVIGNLVPSCPKCNSSKRAKDPKIWYFQQPFATKTGWRNILQKINTKVSDQVAQLALF